MKTLNGLTLGQQIKSISVIGLGLIGTSLVRAVKAVMSPTQKIFICGYDNNFSPRDQKDILAYGLDRFETNFRFLCASDLIVLASPVQENIKLIKKIRPFVKATSLVTDVSSTKAEMMKSAEQLTNTFIGLHPIAGSELRGYRNSDANLFRGKPFIVCASKSDLKQPKAAELLSLIEAIGGEVSVMDAVTHDEVFSRLSHLPQLVSTLLATVAEDDLDKAGTGLISLLRLAGSDFAVWQDILSTNRENVATSLDAFSASLKTLSKAIRAGDDKTLSKLFEKANRAYSKKIEHKLLLSAKRD
ncbi:MAG: prephenate dehydrogenase/arogenate dehydrogenase family protein [Rhizobacter sp.]|nr:prephenate dehydrogenase/arogenate dehydrogenase family protein [Chlorobiales bacterium]